MMDLIKESWFKFRARVYLEKVKRGPGKRRDLRLNHTKNQEKYNKYITAYIESSKI